MNLKRTSLTASIALMFAAVAVPSHAQTAKDFEEMRMEMKRLREELDTLKKERQAQPAPAAAPASSPAPAAASDLADRVEQIELRSKDAVVAGDIGKSFRLPNSETSMRLYGFAELNAVYEGKGDNSNNDYSTFLPYAPINGTAEANRKGRTFLHARTSRIGIEASTPTSYGPLSVKVEGDFNNDPRTGNAAVSGSIANIFTQQATNSYNFRLRHAYGAVGGWLIGQTWSTFMDVDNSPETVDFNGPIGSTFIRQPQIRYTYGTADMGSFSVALENADSYVLEASTGLPSVAGFSRVPDLIGRWDKSFGWGSMSVRGVSHDHRLKDGAAVSVSRHGYGFGVSTLVKTVGDDFLTAAVTGGNGIGRYFNYIEGAFYDDVNNKILMEKALGVVLGYQHRASDTLRFNGVVGWQHNYDNEYTEFARASALDSGQYGINRSVWQAHLGLIWNPVKEVDIGAEYIFGRRKTLADEQGDMSRVNLSAKYYFN